MGYVIYVLMIPIPEGRGRIYNSIIEDRKMVGSIKDRLYYAADYFDKMYEYAILLIKRERHMWTTYRQKRLGI